MGGLWGSTHRIWSRFPDVLFYFLSDRTHSPMAVGLGSCRSCVVHSCKGVGHVGSHQSNVDDPHCLKSPHRPAGDGSGGMVDRERIQPVCNCLPVYQDGYQRGKMSTLKKMRMN